MYNASLGSLVFFYNLYPPLEGYQRCVFSREGQFCCHEVFFRVYSPLVDSLGFMAVDGIKEQFIGFTQSNKLTFSLINALTLQVREHESRGEYI